MFSFMICMLSLSFMDDVLCGNGFANSWFGFLFIWSHLPPSYQPYYSFIVYTVLLHEPLTIGSSKNLSEVLTCFLSIRKTTYCSHRTPLRSLYFKSHRGSDTQLAHDNRMLILYRDNCPHGPKCCDRAARMNYLFLSQNNTLIC